MYIYVGNIPTKLISKYNLIVIAVNQLEKDKWQNYIDLINYNIFYSLNTFTRKRYYMH